MWLSRSNVVELFVSMRRLISGVMFPLFCGLHIASRHSPSVCLLLLYISTYCNGMCCCPSACFTIFVSSWSGLGRKDKYASFV